MTVINLAKGQRVDLTKAVPGLRNIKVGLGWDERTTAGVKFDLDAVLIQLDADNKPIAGNPVVYYNVQQSDDGAIKHSGDNRTGAGDGDDEYVLIDLSTLSEQTAKVIVASTIYEAETNGVTFGQVNNASVRIVNMGDDLADVADDTELMRYDLSEDYSVETAMVMGELYRHNGEWKFGAVGQGYAGGLPGLLTAYGLITG